MTSPKALGEIISLAGGKIIGRTRLQKSVCALELTGLGYGFQFSYRHFGPYSEDLKIACDDADALGYIKENAEATSWGGWYSIFETNENANAEVSNSVQQKRQELLTLTANAKSVELELAITAAFLAKNGVKDPWTEVAIRKPTKADPNKLKGAKILYKDIAKIKTPEPLPAIV